MARAVRPPGRNVPLLLPSCGLVAAQRRHFRQRLQRYAGHVKQVGMAAMTGTAGAGLVGRYVIIVDEDIDPSDVDQVLWAVAMRSDPQESIDIVHQTTAPYLDPRIPPEKRAANDFTMSRRSSTLAGPFDGATSSRAR